MQATGGLSLGEGFTIIPPPPPTFFNFGGAYVTNAPQNDSTFGDYTAMNSDGTVFVAGAPNINNVYVYSRSGTTWSLLQTITGTGSYFGVTVSLSSDGLTLVVGNQSGSAKIYTRANTGTTFNNTFTTSATRVDKVKITSNGSAAIYTNVNNRWLQFSKYSGSWSELTTYSYGATPTQPVIATNNDGSRVAYAITGLTVSGNISAGQVYVLSWGGTATAPTLIQTINDPNPAALNRFGHNLDMSVDGNTLILTSRYNGNSDKGAVYIYYWNGSQYDLQQSIIGTADGQKFGYSNTLKGDILMLTQLGATPNQYKIYTRSGSSWSLQQTSSLPASFTSHINDGTNNGYSDRSVMSADGNHFIVVEATGTSRFVYYYQGG